LFQIVEEGGRDNDDADATERTPLRVQFAADVDKATSGADASTSTKHDALPLQPVTSDDGYLTSSYLTLIDSPTDTAAATATGDHLPFFLPCKFIHESLESTIYILVTSVSFIFELFVTLHEESLQCFDAVGWAAGRASGL